MRELPLYAQQTAMGSMPVTQLSTAGANALAGASQELGAFAGAIRENSQKVERYRAQATMREEMHRIARETPADPAALTERLNAYGKNFVSGLPGYLQDEFREIYRLESIPHVDMATNKYNDSLRNDLTTYSLQNFNANAANLETATKLLESSDVPEQRQAAMNMLVSGANSIKQIADETDGEGQYLYTPAQRQQMLSEAVAAPIRALSAQGQMMALNPPAGFEANLQLIHGAESVADLSHINEDGVNKKGEMTYAYRGINSDANKKEFAQLKAMIDAGKTTEAAAYVDKIYKEKYWDAVGIDELPPAVQGIVFDAAVNQGPAFAKKLKSEALKGAGAVDLLAMREERYAKTEGTPQERKSWAARLRSYMPVAIGQNVDMMDVDTRTKIMESAQKVLREEERLKAEDYPSWAYQKGMNHDEVYLSQKLQNEYRTPSIMTKPEAKAAAQQLNTTENYQELIAKAQTVNPSYLASYNKDLREAGANPVMRTALKLAVENPSRYAQHIEYAVAWGKPLKEGEMTRAESLTAAGHKPADIQTKVNEALLDADIYELINNESSAVSAMETTGDIESSVYGMAAGYLLANRDASIDDAMSFAMQPILGDDLTTKANGFTIRVPRDVDPKVNVGQELERFLKTKVQDKTIANELGEGGFTYWDDIIPVLSNDKKSYNFVTKLRGAVVDKDGQPLKIDIQDLTSYRGKLEKAGWAGVEVGIPYAERERMRKEALGLDVKKPGKK